MATISFTCAYCGKAASQPAGAVRRAQRNGFRLFCDKACSALGRRKNKTKAQKVEEKRLYDIEYRRRNCDLLKEKKAAYFQRTYDPTKARIERKKRSARHAEYCRRPEYREWKREYDRHYRAERDYGEYADCFLLTMDIRDECLSQQSDYEIRLSKGGLSKTTQRRRDYERTISKKSEIGPLGNLERGERG